MEAKFASLQKQVTQIQDSMAASQAEQYLSPPVYQSSRNGSLQDVVLPVVRGQEQESRHSRETTKRIGNRSFIGPTSSLYSLNVGKSSLRSMGVQPDSEHTTNEPNSVFNSPCQSPRPKQRGNSFVQDTLISMGSQEASRLIEIYKEELVPIYPFIDISHTVDHLQLLLNYSDAPPTYGRLSEQQQADFDSRSSDILMVVLASALTIEALGQSTLADQIIDTVETVRSKRSRTSPANIQDVITLTMMVSKYNSISFSVKCAVNLSVCPECLPLSL